MSRRRSGVFDPDYRKAGWSQSQYAPKNSSTGITQTAALFAGIVAFIYMFGVPAVLPETKSLVQSLVGIAIGGVIYFAVWIFLAVQIRGREFRKLRKLYGIRTEAELNAPEVIERRANAQKRTKAASQFELEVASLLRRLTKHQVDVVGGRGDGGVDIEISEGNKVIGIVQCKQYREQYSLSPSHIRELAAVKTQRSVNIAYLVTTARFTTDSREEATKYGIKLIDGASLADLKAKADKKTFGQAIQ